MKLPPAGKYEVRFFGPYRPTVCTVDPAEALAALDADGEIAAVRNCTGRVAAARINGHLLTAREYGHYMDLTDGGKVRESVETSHGGDDA